MNGTPSSRTNQSAMTSPRAMDEGTDGFAPFNFEIGNILHFGAPGIAAN